MDVARLGVDVDDHDLAAPGEHLHPVALALGARIEDATPGVLLRDDHRLVQADAALGKRPRLARRTGSNVVEKAIGLPVTRHARGRHDGDDQYRPASA